MHFYKPRSQAGVLLMIFFDKLIKRCHPHKINVKIITVCKQKPVDTLLRLRSVMASVPSPQLYLVAQR